RVFKDGDADGRPWFTMRFVRGGTLADRLSELRADPKKAVRLLVQVIDAVEYLHRQGPGPPHLKPSSILPDEARLTSPSDGGLAKALWDLPGVLGPEGVCPPTTPPAPPSTPNDETLTAMPTQAGRPRTRTGAKLGTYAYMSPEQAEGDVHQIGPASDIYA